MELTYYPEPVFELCSITVPRVKSSIARNRHRSVQTSILLIIRIFWLQLSCLSAEKKNWCGMR